MGCCEQGFSRDSYILVLPSFSDVALHSCLVLLFLLARQKKKKQKEKRLPDLSLRGSGSRLSAVGNGSIGRYGAGFPSAAFYLLG
jgi:hypothetical protein